MSNRDFLPTRCVSCDRPGEVVCEACRTAFAEPPPLPARIRPGVALGRHSGTLRRCVLALKYRDAPAVARALAPLLALAIDAADMPLPTAIVPAPTTPVRVRNRGYDPASTIAHALAAETGIPELALLVRRPGPPQQDARDRVERTKARPFRFLLEAGTDAPARALVVDDVVTTGTTLAAARRLLAAHGSEVTIAALSAAPIGSGGRGPREPV